MTKRELYIRNNFFTQEEKDFYTTHTKNYQTIKNIENKLKDILTSNRKEEVPTLSKQYLDMIIDTDEAKILRVKYKEYGVLLKKEAEERADALNNKIAFWKDYFQSHPKFFEAYIKQELKIDLKFFNPTEENMREVCQRMRNIPKGLDTPEMRQNIIRAACTSDIPVYMTIAVLQSSDRFIVRLRTKQPVQRDAHYDHNDSCIVDMGYKTGDRKSILHDIPADIQSHLEIIDRNKKEDNSGRSHVHASNLYRYNTLYDNISPGVISIPEKISKK